MLEIGDETTVRIKGSDAIDRVSPNHDSVVV
jgi:hypothetical protein